MRKDLGGETTIPRRRADIEVLFMRPVVRQLLVVHPVPASVAPDWAGIPCSLDSDERDSRGGRSIIATRGLNAYARSTSLLRSMLKAGFHDRSVRYMAVTLPCLEQRHQSWP